VPPFVFTAFSFPDGTGAGWDVITTGSGDGAEGAPKNDAMDSNGEEFIN